MMLSKTEYMLFVKHPAWLWVKKNDPGKIPPIDANTQAIFDAGHQFEQYAEALFPQGVSLGFSDFRGYQSLVRRTQDAIKGGGSVLFQPRFLWKDYTCISDIVDFVAKDEVDLYEIKGSTKVKPEHEYDLAFQVAVLEGTGLRVRDVYVIHANRDYVRQGKIEAEKITKIVNVTDAVNQKKEFTRESMAQALVVANAKKMPDPNPARAKLGSKKDWLQVYANIVPKSPQPNAQYTPPSINKDAIGDFLNDLEYPLYFLDYETMRSLVPYFDGHRPYQQVPFQYSLHILESPDAELSHKEYLHKENSDPARPLVEHLIANIGKKGSIMVWFESFEKSRNNELGVMLAEYRENMKEINARIVDLITPFSQKWYDDRRFEGSASIKQVLPVLCPELSYLDLGIQEGSSAQRLWMEAILDDKHPGKKEQILGDLIKYCRLDTLAMVEIYKKLQVLVG